MLIIGLMMLGVFQNSNGDSFTSQKNFAGAMFFISVNLFMNAYLGTT